VITAFSSPSILENVLQAGLTTLTTNTITDAEELRKQIDTVHAQGLAVEVQTYRIGQLSLAAPIIALAYRGIDDYPACAGLAVTGRVGRIAAGRLAAPLSAAARAISARLSTMSGEGIQDWPRAVVGRRQSLARDVDI
jgi:DNA-binding IclR family transcriptional regulator